MKLAENTPNDQIIWAVAAGIIFLILLWLVNGILTKKFSLSHYVLGTDSRPSASKLQFFVFTIIFLFGYVSIHTILILNNQLTLISEIPTNILLAMGFSVATLVGSKAITVSYINRGKIIKQDGTEPSNADLVQTDTGDFDFTKFQMLAWTLVGSIYYIVQISKFLAHPNIFFAEKTGTYSFPDIDGSLMVLMGLGHGAFLGKKLVTENQPKLSGITNSQPANSNGYLPVTINGSGLTGSQDGNAINIDGFPMPSVTATDWKEDHIDFLLPSIAPNRIPFKKGQLINISVTVSGITSNSVPFTI